MDSPHKGVRRYLPYLRPYTAQVVTMCLAAIVAIVAATAIPQVIKAIIDGPVAHRQAGDLPLYAGLVLALALVEAAGNFVRRNLSGSVSFRMETDLRNDFYAHLQSLQVAFHDNWQSGQLLSRAIGDINTVRRFVGFGLIFGIVFLVQFGAVVFMLFRLDVLLAALTALMALPVAAISRHFFTKYAVIARRVQDQQGDVTTVIEEMATGVRIIKAFGRDALLFARYRDEVSELRETNFVSVDTRAQFWTLMTLLPNLILVLVVLLGGFATLNHQLSVGGLVAFITYLFMLIWPMDALGWILAMGDEAQTASIRLSEVFDSLRDVADAPGATALPAGRGEIRFENVSFAYPEGRAAVLDGVDLHVRAGETMALVGRVGSGKTTLALLVPRLYDVTGGRVTVDGHDVRDVTLRSLRAQIGTAFEDPILFSASVHENLVMGRAITDDEDLKQAIEVAEAGFVWELPWGLETRVGEQGYTLSGGQRQRLALARAVLGRPRILILDDPLSSVDVHTEAQIEAALRKVLAGATALLVAHRPSTLALADRVALLDGGRILAVGTHSELMRTQPLYRQLLAQEAEAMERGAAS
ncbi:MAG TPA: ABC transporter ATP-binding protein [Candidatus Dormibacteraeota bacterium]